MAVRVKAVEARLADMAQAQSQIQSLPPKAPQTLTVAPPKESEPQHIPARMLNEFVYCQRLFYYEFVEGVFVESADTLRGGAIHQRVDSGRLAIKPRIPRPRGRGPVEARRLSRRAWRQNQHSAPARARPR
jgi:hypothetical protein